MRKWKNVRKSPLKSAVHICLLAVGATLGPARPARAQPNPEPSESRRIPVAVFVTAQPGRMSPARHTEVLLATQRALRDNDDLEVIDADVLLANRAGLIPNEEISEARGLLESGEALLRKGRAGPARLRLETAARLLDVGLAFVSKQELARAQFLVGAAHAILGHKKEARKWFTRLQVWRTGFVADPSLEPGKVLPLWEASQRAVDRRPGGSIEILSEPGGALAYVDGSLIGPTPATAEALVAGEHYVTLKLAGYQRTVRGVSVSGKVQEIVSANLPPLPHYDELREHVAGVVAGLGAPTASSVLLKIADLLEIRQAFFVRVPVPGSRDSFEAFLYDARNRKLLARAEARATGDEEVEAVLAKLTRTVYAGLALHSESAPRTLAKKPVPKKKKGKPFYRKWWFWTGLTAAVTVPVLWNTNLSFDLTRGPHCPHDRVCGDVILEF